MKISINDKEMSVKDGLTLENLLQNLDLESAYSIAIAINETVIPHAQWTLTKIEANDRVLIVQPTQGG